MVGAAPGPRERLRGEQARAAGIRRGARRGGRRVFVHPSAVGLVVDARARHEHESRARVPASLKFAHNVGESVQVRIRRADLHPRCRDGEDDDVGGDSHGRERARLEHVRAMPCEGRALCGRRSPHGAHVVTSRGEFPRHLGAHVSRAHNPRCFAHGGGEHSGKRRGGKARPARLVPVVPWVYVPPRRGQGMGLDSAAGRTQTLLVRIRGPRALEVVRDAV
jgi:hypothetical protein